MNTNVLKEWTRWLFDKACIGIAVIWLLSLTPLGRDDSDVNDWGGRSGMSPRTDALTGCQYLATSAGGITPRVDASGKQIGCRSQP